MQVEMFVEMFAPMGEIVQQMGRSCTRLEQPEVDAKLRIFVPYYCGE